MTEIGKHLRRLREDSREGRLTVEAVRDRMGGRSNNTVVNLEKDGANPTWSSIEAHLEATGSSLADLVWAKYKDEARPWPLHILHEQMRAAGIDPESPGVSKGQVTTMADHVGRAVHHLGIVEDGLRGVATMAAADEDES